MAETKRDKAAEYFVFYMTSRGAASGFVSFQEADELNAWIEKKGAMLSYLHVVVGITVDKRSRENTDDQDTTVV